MLVFIDVDGLKRVNDERGHLAGDALLRHVAHTIRGQLRPYDHVVRFGGDEFICALPHVTLEQTRSRFAAIGRSLADDPIGGSITIGCAELAPGDSLEQLIERADADLLATRQGR